MMAINNQTRSTDENGILTHLETHLTNAQDRFIIDLRGKPNLTENYNIVKLTGSENQNWCIQEYEARDLTSFSKEEEAFIRMKKALLNTHKDKYVAIFGGKVVDYDVNETKLIKRFYNKHGHVPVYIARVTEEEELFSIPTPLFGKE